MIEEGFFYVQCQYICLCLLCLHLLEVIFCGFFSSGMMEVKGTLQKISHQQEPYSSNASAVDANTHLNSMREFTWECPCMHKRNMGIFCHLE